MSLSTGPDTVQVYVEVETTDAYGNKVRRASDVPVTLRGYCQPSTAEESQDLGQSVGTTYRFISKTFPGGAFARVEWDGRLWDVIGEPRRHRRGHHVTTYIKARGAGS